jgi:hypothetical protein
MKRTLQQHINDDRSEIESGTVSPQRKRHLQSELEDLKKYQENHPDEEKDPSPLELFCDLNPEEPECRIYD